MTRNGWAIVTGASGGMGLTNRLLILSGTLAPRFILRWLMTQMFAPIARLTPIVRLKNNNF
jgi:hypothetical protein